MALLGTDVDIQLTEKLKETVKEYLSKTLQFGNCTVRFKARNSGIYDALAIISSPESTDVHLLFNAYLLDGEIRISLVTLTSVQLVDTAARHFIHELQALLSSK
jgi:hypothetical protein